MKPNATTTLPQPDWNDEDSIAQALAALRDAHDEESAHEAYDRFLWAVGDNQTGTFYPIVLATLPELEKLLINGNFWAQRAVLESLIDLAGSFIPQEGYASHEGVAVQQALQTAVHAMRAPVSSLCTGDDARARSAAELIELIDDQTDRPVH